MNKNIKYLIEDIVNFNPADYSDEQPDILDRDTIYDIITETPKDKEELIKVIKRRFTENEFGDDNIIFPNLSDIDVSKVSDMQKLFSYVLPEYGMPVKLDLSDWNMFNVTNIISMFENCETIVELDLSGWNTSNINSMRWVFHGCENLTKVDLSGWDTSNVTDMCAMFSGCKSLIELDLLGFDTSEVRDIQAMFNECASLKKLDLSNFNTSNMENMRYAFNDCRELKELNLSGWDTSKASRLYSMFWKTPLLKKLITDNKQLIDAYNGHRPPNLIEKMVNFNPADYSDEESDIINQDDIRRITQMPETKKELMNLIKQRVKENPKEPYLLDIDPSLITTATSLFKGDIFRSVEVLDLSTWDMSGVTTMSKMFASLYHLKTLKLSKKFTSSNVRDMSNMFYCCESLTELDLSNFDTSNVKNMSYMFRNCKSLTELDLSSFDTSKVTTMKDMFSDCSSLIKLNVSSFDTSNVTNMSSMFSACGSLTELDLSSFYIPKVKTTFYMFCGCWKLKHLNISNFNPSNAISLCSMFASCNSLVDLNISHWDTSKVESMDGLFYGCYELTEIDLSQWDTSNVENIAYMFYGCKNLTTLNMTDFNIDKAMEDENCIYCLFAACPKLTNLITNNRQIKKLWRHYK